MPDASPAPREPSIDPLGPRKPESIATGAGAIWDRIPEKIDHATGSIAKEALWPRISVWLNRLLDYPGFRDWKNEAIRRHMTFAVIPQAEIGPFEDFRFDSLILRQHDIVAGYVRLMKAATICRSTQHYFRRYPFRGLPIGRDEHLSTCAELYYSRVYQFRERLFRLLAWIERRTSPKDLNVKALQAAFNEQLKAELEARNRIHHEEAYADFELDALGQTDLLASVDAEWPRMTDAGYRRIARQWRQRVQMSADKLDFWVGVVAVLMLVRCSFLPDPEVKDLGMEVSHHA